jgi:hypothetical protein
MFCPQCGAATEAHIKYCKACGFKLVDFGIRPPASESLSPTEAKSQLHRLKGTRTLVASLLLWPPTLFTLLVATTGHGPEEEFFAIISFFLVLLSFAASGWGVFNLWRGGFFNTYKEQRIRAEAALLAAPPEPVRLPPQREAPREIAPVPAVSVPSMFSNSVTEHTTRELHSHPSKSEKIT